MDSPVGIGPSKSIAESLHGPVSNAVLLIGSGRLGQLTNDIHSRFCIVFQHPFPSLATTLYFNLACVASVSVRFRSKERGTRVKDRAKKWCKLKEHGGGGKKGRKRLQTNPSILKTAHLACHAWVHALTFDAVISCHNWPIKCLSFRGAEMNLKCACVKPK